MASPLKLIIRELEIPYCGGQPFKGRIFSGNPSRLRPRDVPLDKWCASIVRLSTDQWKSRVCVPSSLLLTQEMRREYSTATNGRGYLNLVDDIGTIADDGFDSPARDVREIIECLTRGDDVLILSRTRKISGFLPAILFRLFDPRCHILKILWTIDHSGYEITNGQRGYIAGLSDAEHLQWLSAMHCNVDQRSWEVDDVVIGDDDDKEASSATHENDQLSQQLKFARTQLKAIGGELLSEISYEMLDLTNFLTECEKHPLLGNVAYLGFLSIGYRFCDASKFLAALGHECLVIKPNAENVKKLARPDVESMQHKAATYQAQFFHLADQLEHYRNCSFGYLTCDLDVLAGHPEVAKVKGVADSVKLIRDEIQRFGERLEEITALAQRLSKNLNIEEAAPPPKKDRDWKAMQAMVRQCIDASFGNSRDSNPE